MATLSIFYGIIIQMRPELNERHHGAHIHAKHAGKEASYNVISGERIAGELEREDEVKVLAWMAIHKEDLMANWELLNKDGTFCKIEPLH